MNPKKSSLPAEASMSVLRSPIKMVEEKAKKSGDVNAKWERALRMKKRSPVVLSLGQPKMKEIPVSQYHLLEVDSRYQRDIQPEEVADLIQVLKKGGSIADPITLAQRGWEDPYSKPGKYYIVDGQQRTMAYMEVGLPIPSVIFQTSSLEEERALFIVMNTRVNVHPNALVASWDGPLAEAIRSANASPAHPLYERIILRGSGGGATGIRRNFMACSLAKAAAGAIHGQYDQGRLPNILSKADGTLRGDGSARIRLKTFLELAGLVFPPGEFVKVLGMHSLAVIAHAKWKERGAELPSPAILKRLASIKWEEVVLGHKTLYRPVTEGAIRGVWK